MNRIVLVASAATRFRESRRSPSRMHRDHEPLAVWSPGFSRAALFVPPEGGTPNQRRFMESGASGKNSRKIRGSSRLSGALFRQLITGPSRIVRAHLFRIQ